MTAAMGCPEALKPNGIGFEHKMDFMNRTTGKGCEHELVQGGKAEEFKNEG